MNLQRVTKFDLPYTPKLYHGHETFYEALNYLLSLFKNAMVMNKFSPTHAYKPINIVTFSLNEQNMV
jgi:hypothetical protein